MEDVKERGKCCRLGKEKKGVSRTKFEENMIKLRHGEREKMGSREGGIENIWVS